MTELTHTDADGRARMIDVGGKPETRRVATAGGRLETTAEVVALVRADGLPKADVLPTARIAGISGAKRTSELIPLCHPLPLDSLTVDFELGEASIGIRATAATTGRTGVEMEALTAVAVAGLTLHDMVKAVDPSATLTDVRLLEKSGGKRGEWQRSGGSDAGAASRPGSEADSDAGTASGPGAEAESESAPESESRSEPGSAPESESRSEPVPGSRRPAAVRRGTAAVLVASTRAASGVRADTTGQQLAQALTRLGLAVGPVRIVADADIGAALRDALDRRPAVLITTGGTGVSPTDATADATRALLDVELPGVAEAIRARGLLSTPTAALSRGTAGIADGTIVVNLAGSPGAVRDGCAVLADLLPHLLDQVAGGDHRA